VSLERIIAVLLFLVHAQVNLTKIRPIVWTFSILGHVVPPHHPLLPYCLLYLFSYPFPTLQDLSSPLISVVDFLFSPYPLMTVFPVNPPSTGSGVSYYQREGVCHSTQNYPV